MERMSVPNRVNVSAATASALDGAFHLKARGAVEMKRLAPIDMFYVVGPSRGRWRPAGRHPSDSTDPNVRHPSRRRRSVLLTELSG